MPSLRAMADTFRPCRCSSRIIMSSPRVTTVLLPPAKRSSIGGDGAAHLTGNVLAGRPPRQNWGKFDAHKWGGFNARSQKARGVNDILIAVVDGLKGFPEA